MNNVKKSMPAAARLRSIVVTSLVAAIGIAGVASPASASGGHAKDEIAFTAHAYLTPQADGTSRVVLVGDSCTLSADGGAANQCSLAGYGTQWPDGSGTARAVVISRDRVIVFDEVIAATGPATGIATGSVQEVGAGGVRSGTFTAPFSLAPTSDPNVLLDSGTISVRH
jgi:hypothetical protein